MIISTKPWTSATFTGSTIVVRSSATPEEVLNLTDLKHTAIIDVQPALIITIANLDDSKDPEKEVIRRLA